VAGRQFDDQIAMRGADGIRRIKRQLPKWAKLVRDANIKAE